VLAAAVAVVVVLFVVLQPGDDDSTTTPTASSVATTTPGASTEAAAPKPPRPEYVEEAHLHGYDLSRDIGPGKVGRYCFKADIDGIFELELENAGVQIAELRVEP
jgi:hypothetical protein